MDPAAFVEAVESEMGTQLGRLGNQKLLIALTGADLEAETVLSVAATRAAAARETFAAWAGEADDEDAREAFEAVADRESAGYDAIVDELDESEPADGVGGADGAMEALRDLSGPVERAGGLVGWALVADRTRAQFVAFFINEAAPARTDLFRERRESAREARDRGGELLAATCSSDDDWERAEAAAEAVVQAAYDEYAATLEGMGLDPKPVC